MEKEPSDQSPFQKLNFGSSSQEKRKIRDQTVVTLSSFTAFLYFVPNILTIVLEPLTDLLKPFFRKGLIASFCKSDKMD